MTTEFLTHAEVAACLEHARIRIQLALATRSQARLDDAREALDHVGHALTFSDFPFSDPAVARASDELVPWRKRYEAFVSEAASPTKTAPTRSALDIDGAVSALRGVRAVLDAAVAEPTKGRIAGAFEAFRIAAVWMGDHVKEFQGHPRVAKAWMALEPALQQLHALERITA